MGSSLINLVTPAASSFVILLVITRLLMGALQAGIFGAAYGRMLHCVMSSSPLINSGVVIAWFPLKERSVAFGLLAVGLNLGSMLTNYLSGYISDHQGWPYVFYICGQ